MADRRREIDVLLDGSLAGLAADPHILGWNAKECDWVSYFTFRHLLPRVRVGAVISDPAQIGIEVAVPQPPGYERMSTRRDIVLWETAGASCWSNDWSPLIHPIAVIEWKVHRPGRRNKFVNREREWLRKYCHWQPSVTAYAIEVTAGDKIVIECHRYEDNDERVWRSFEVAR